MNTELYCIVKHGWPLSAKISVFGRRGTPHPFFSNNASISKWSLNNLPNSTKNYKIRHTKIQSRAVSKTTSVNHYWSIFSDLQVVSKKANQKGWLEDAKPKTLVAGRGVLFTHVNNITNFGVCSARVHVNCLKRLLVAATNNQKVEPGLTSVIWEVAGCSKNHYNLTARALIEKE